MTIDKNKIIFIGGDKEIVEAVKSRVIKGRDGKKEQRRMGLVEATRNLVDAEDFYNTPTTMDDLEELCITLGDLHEYEEERLESAEKELKAVVAVQTTDSDLLTAVIYLLTHPLPPEFWQ